MPTTLEYMEPSPLRATSRGALYGSELARVSARSAQPTSSECKEGFTQLNPNSGCRFCKAPLHTTFVDLGMSPLCQTHIKPEHLHQMEAFYPLHVYICDEC